MDEGRITEIGTDLRAGTGERVIDATGCYVTPGFIETHNHWDGGVWWSPNMEPLPAYGVTTSINGNCAFSMAPAPKNPEDQENLIEIFNFFEDIPEEPMKKLVPWDWSLWSEYKASMMRNVRVPVNYAAFCGHIPIRLTVMGQEAWKRTASPEEIEQMCALLDDALAAGAMGLSSNQLDYDKHDRPLPSQLADDAEYRALLEVLARYEGATFQVIVDHFMRMTGPEQTERLGRIAQQAGVRMQWAGLPTLKFQAEVGKRSKELARAIQGRRARHLHRIPPRLTDLGDQLRPIAGLRAERQPGLADRGGRGDLGGEERHAVGSGLARRRPRGLGRRLQPLLSSRPVRADAARERDRMGSGRHHPGRLHRTDRTLPSLGRAGRLGVQERCRIGCPQALVGM